jgi:hypothetical protein
MQGLTPGRIVHFVLPADHHHFGQHRPAIVVRVLADAHGKPLDDGSCNLHVFLDGQGDRGPARNDDQPAAPSTRSVFAARHDDSHGPGTWHFIEHA